jgi:hypothetical protein
MTVSITFFTACTTVVGKLNKNNMENCFCLHSFTKFSEKSFIIHHHPSCPSSSSCSTVPDQNDGPPLSRTRACGPEVSTDRPATNVVTTATKQ